MITRTQVLKRKAGKKKYDPFKAFVKRSGMSYLSNGPFNAVTKAFRAGQRSGKQQVRIDLRNCFDRLDHLLYIAESGGWDSTGVGGPTETLAYLKELVPQLCKRYKWNRCFSKKMYEHGT